MIEFINYQKSSDKIAQNQMLEAESVILKLNPSSCTSGNEETIEQESKIKTREELFGDLISTLCQSLKNSNNQ